jgi:hypothetical protein
MTRILSNLRWKTRRNYAVEADERTERRQVWNKTAAAQLMYAGCFVFPFIDNVKDLTRFSVLYVTCEYITFLSLVYLLLVLSYCT